MKVMSAARIAKLLATADWYEVVIAPGVDLRLPGIYQWTIEGENGGIYIGKFSRLRRPLREYQNNVAKLETGKPYRLGNPVGFRRVHRALFEAKTNGRAIRLTILENCDIGHLSSREMELINAIGTLNGALPLRSPTALRQLEELDATNDD